MTAYLDCVTCQGTAAYGIVYVPNKQRRSVVYTLCRDCHRRFVAGDPKLLGYLDRFEASALRAYAAGLPS